MRVLDGGTSLEAGQAAVLHEADGGEDGVHVLPSHQVALDHQVHEVQVVLAVTRPTGVDQLGHLPTPKRTTQTRSLGFRV